MNNEQENPRNEKLDDEFAGLQQLAKRLDRQNFPGQAWTAPVNHAPEVVMVPRSSRRRSLLLTAAATVACLACGYYFLAAPRIDNDSPSLVANQNQEVEHLSYMSEVESTFDTPFVNLPTGDATAEENMVELVIVEDSNSYSVIDMSTGTPLISYVRKDSFDVSEVTPAYSVPSDATDDQI